MQMPPGLSDVFEPSSDIDALAENVAVFDDDVPDVDANTELDALVRSHSHVALGHTALLLHGAADSVHSANELDQYPVACAFDDSSAMFGDVGLEKFAPVRVEARERALLVGPHKPAVAGDITSENGGEPPLDSPIGHATERGGMARLEVGIRYLE